ncbi:hypothetical protein [Aquisphaera insulae]|uniref:hypothetical protein n=1 Tax=Aquisphaera insulae TaxID=2712864 RepID=UPI0013EC597F|nr:hypothetical protein [Aquisphaera insulae]
MKWSFGLAVCLTVNAMAQPSYSQFNRMGPGPNNQPWNSTNTGYAASVLQQQRDQQQRQEAQSRQNAARMQEITNQGQKNYEAQRATSQRLEQANRESAERNRKSIEAMNVRRGDLGSERSFRPQATDDPDLNDGAVSDHFGWRGGGRSSIGVRLAVVLLLIGGLLLWLRADRGAFGRAFAGSTTPPGDGRTGLEAMSREQAETNVETGQSAREHGPFPRDRIHALAGRIPGAVPVSLIVIGILCVLFGDEVGAALSGAYDSIREARAKGSRFQSIMDRGREALHAGRSIEAEERFAEAREIYREAEDAAEWKLAEAARSDAQKQREAEADGLLEAFVRSRARKKFEEAAGLLAKAGPLAAGLPDQVKRLEAYRAGIDADRRRLPEYQAAMSRGETLRRGGKFIEAIRQFEAAQSIYAWDDEAKSRATQTAADRDQAVTALLAEARKHVVEKHDDEADRAMTRVVEVMGGPQVAEAHRLRVIARDHLAEEAARRIRRALAGGEFELAVRLLDEARERGLPTYRTDQVEVEARFRRSMQRSDQALERRDYREAGRFAESAAALRPDDPAARERISLTSTAVRFAETEHLPWPDRPVSRLVPRHDGSELVAIGSDGLVRVWSLEERASRGTPVREWPPPGGDRVLAVALAADGLYAARALTSGRIELRELDGGNTVTSPPPTGEPISCLAVFHDESNGIIRLAAGDQGGGIRIWKVRGSTWDAIRVPPIGRPRPVTGLAFSRQRGDLGVGFDGANVVLFRARGANYDEFGICDRRGDVARERLTSLCFSPDELTLVAGWSSGLITGWATTSRKLVTFRKVHDHRVSDVGFSNDGRLFASVSDDGKLMHGFKSRAEGDLTALTAKDRGSRASPPREAWVFRDTVHPSPHGTPIQAICYLGANGLATAAEAGPIRVWSLNEGQFAADLAR